jgi:nucleolar protein 15
MRYKCPRILTTRTNLFDRRIPHGFYEPQIKKYFTQFGRVTRYRVSRNKKTGASKHYAFVEFASAEVAEIVAKTMDKYLMFGHILQCRVIPTEQVPPNLWVGANKRFKVMPRNKIAGAEMARGVERVVWDKRVENEKNRRTEQQKKLKEDFGYEFTPPTLKTTNAVAKKILALEDSPSQQLLLEAAPEEIPDALVTEKKSKPRNKGKNGNVDLAIEQVEEEKVETPTQKKPRKGKKAKAEPVIEEVVEEVVETPAEEVTTKAKKTKKGANADAAAETVVKEKKRKAVPADAGDAEPRKSRRSKAKA